ncbi:MAG: hypothetical protein RL266_2754 [Bacteroidota bacterium]
MKHLLLPFLGFGLLLTCCRYDVEEEEVPEFSITIPAAGNQEANRLIPLSDGILIVGSTETGNSKEAFLWKIDFNGNVRWQRNLGQGTEGWSVKQTSDNALILAGTISSQTSDKNILLMKLDLNGNTLWQQQFGGPMSDIGRDVIELQNGGFMVIGTTQSFGPGPASMYVVRTDDNGMELWSRTFGGDGVDGGSELLELDGFEVLLFGFTGSFGAGDRDIYLQSVSTEGDSLASFTFGGSGYEESQAIQLTADGGFVMSNHSASTDPTHKLLATKLDLNRQVVWEQEFGGLTEHEGGEGVLADSEGNYVFLGRTNSFGSAEQVYFIKTDPNGNVLEELNFGAEGDQRGTDLIEKNGAYYVLGTSTVDGDIDVMLIKRPM